MANTKAFVRRKLSFEGNVPPSVCLVFARDSVEATNNESCRKQLQIVPESLELIRSIQKPIAAVAICGPYRTGKSYFLSRMLGDSEYFKVGHSTEMCTRGIWMATSVLECDEFVVIFFDTEGIGAVDDPIQSSTSFVILAALTSSLLIYNTKRPLQLKDIEKLRWCVTMSKHIQKIRSECQPQMANFLWLLRDMDLNLGTTSPTEWLLQKLQAPRCKEISEGLTNSFSRIECAFLPPPAVENELLQDIIQRKDQLTPHFNTHVEETKVQILSAIESKLCAGAPVSAFSMTSLIEKCVSEINHQMNIPVLDAKWKIAIEMQLQEYASKLAAEYEKDMASKVRNLLPIEEGSLKSSDKVTLMGIHNEILEKKCSMLESKLASLVPTKDIHNIFWKIVQQEFVSKIVEKDSNGQVNGGKLLMFLHENYQISSEACSKTYTKFYDQIVASKLRFAIAEGIPYDIAPDVAEFEEKYNRIACGPAKAKVFTDSRILSEIDEHQLKLIPGHIEDLKVIGINNNRIKLTWSRPLVNPSAAHSYEVYITKEDGSLILVETTKNCYALIQNLESNKQYTFVVRAKNDQFSGSYVSHVAAKTTLTSVARSAVGIGTFLALTIGSPVVFPAMFSIGTIFSIRNDIREKRIGSAAAKGLGLALMPLALPVGVLGTMVAAPCIAIDAFESHGPVGDLSTSVSEERREAV